MLTFALLMLFGTFALGYNDILRRKYLVAGADEQTLLTLTMLLSGTVLFVVVFIVGVPLISRSFWMYFSAALLLNIVSQNLFIRAFKFSDASTIAPLRLIIPPLVIVTGFIFLNERPEASGVLGILTTVAGLWLLLSGTLTGARSMLHDRGVLYGLAGSILFAVSFPLDKQAVLMSSGLFFSALLTLGVGICTLMLLRVARPTIVRDMFSELRARPNGYIALTLSWGAGNFLTNEALNYGLAAYASSFKRLQAFWTVLLSRRMLGEQGTGRKVFATLIMLCGIALTLL